MCGMPDTRALLLASPAQPRLPSPPRCPAHSLQAPLPAIHRPQVRRHRGLLLPFPPPLCDPNPAFSSPPPPRAVSSMRAGGSAVPTVGRPAFLQGDPSRPRGRSARSADILAVTSGDVSPASSRQEPRMLLDTSQGTGQFRDKEWPSPRGQRSRGADIGKGQATRHRKPIVGAQPPCEGK